MTTRRNALRLAAAGSVAALPLASRSSAGGLYVPAVGRFTGPNGNRGIFAGHVVLKSVANNNGKLVASVSVAGRLSDLQGLPINSVSEVEVNDVPLQVPPGTCEILVITLGPLRIDLLGLVIEIPMACEIQIYADPEGGLLGRRWSPGAPALRLNRATRERGNNESNHGDVRKLEIITK